MLETDKIKEKQDKIDLMIWSGAILFLIGFLFGAFVFCVIYGKRVISIATGVAFIATGGYALFTRNQLMLNASTLAPAAFGFVIAALIFGREDE
jgi:drug/metabolite transporter (DMT)-like permease